MDKPVHTHNSRYYIVRRPCLWFAAGDEILVEKFYEYYTQKAVKSLLDHGFIEVKSN